MHEFWELHKIPFRKKKNKYMKIAFKINGQTKNKRWNTEIYERAV